MRRTISLPDEDGVAAGPGAVKLGGLQRGAAGGLTVGYPDTLEVIHHPAPSAPPATPTPPEAPVPPSEPPALDDGSTQVLRSAPEELEALLAQFRDQRQRRRSVRAAKLLIAVLASALLGVWLLRPPLPGGDENRAITKFPELTASGLVDGKDYRQADSALRDRLALRQYVVQAVGQTARNQLGTSLNSQVVIGANGVPFLSEDFIFPCEYDFQAAPVNAGLQQLRALGRATGKTITVAIAPDKSSILADQLGSHGPELMTCANRVRNATEQTWPDIAGSPVLYAWKQLLAEQAAHPGKVFQRGDSHWTSQGALVWSRAVISRLIKQGEAPTSLQGAPKATRAPDKPADSDIYKLMGISRTETVPVWEVHRPDVKLRARTIPSPSGRGIAVFHAWSTTAPLIKGRTLVVNDSFFSRAEGQLAPYFSDLEVIHWSDFMTAVQAGNLPHFDRIIIETVQRGWPQRAAWLASGQPVHDALARELSRPSSTVAAPGRR